MIVGFAVARFIVFRAVAEIVFYVNTFIVYSDAMNLAYSADNAVLWRRKAATGAVQKRGAGKKAERSRAEWTKVGFRCNVFLGIQELFEQINTCTKLL